MSNLVLHLIFCLPSTMVRIVQLSLRAALPLLILVVQPMAVAAVKPHVITFGKWSTVQCSPESGAFAENNKPLTLRIRPLLVDAHIREFTLASPHDITDRLFVVRRAFRVNDNLPQESASPPRWQWQLGGWLLVDRTTGHISSINLPDFDIIYSTASWYRDYAAYCGFSDDGKKVYALVAQINRRKPILKKLLNSETTASKETKDAAVDTACPSPTWQRSPARVTFEPPGIPKQTFAVRGHAVDLVNESEEDEEASK